MPSIKPKPSSLLATLKPLFISVTFSTGPRMVSSLYRLGTFLNPLASPRQKFIGDLTPVDTIRSTPRPVPAICSRETPTGDESCRFMASLMAPPRCAEAIDAAGGGCEAEAPAEASSEGEETEVSTELASVFVVALLVASVDEGATDAVSLEFLPDIST